MEKGDRETHIRVSKRTQGHGPSAQKNEWAPRQRDANVYIYFNKQQTTNSTKSVTTEQAGEQMSMPARQRKGGSMMEVLPEAHGRSSEQREPPETCTTESYIE